MIPVLRIMLALCLAACAACAAAAPAAELRVLTAGAAKPLLLAMAPAFEQRTGQRLVVQNDTAGALLRRATAGEAFDVIILTSAGAEQLERAGRVAAGSTRVVARVGIAVGVLPGAPRPDLSSVEGFRAAVMAARSIAVIDPASGGSSGIYLAQMFERMGMGAAVRAKSVLVPGGLTAQRLLSGEADLCIQQASEIVAVPGVVMAGPLPAALQNYTAYAGAVSATAVDPGAAQALLALLGSPEAQVHLRAAGLELP